MKLTKKQCAANISVSIVQSFLKVAHDSRHMITNGIEAKDGEGKPLMMLDAASIRDALGENLPLVEAAIELILKED